MKAPIDKAWTSAEEQAAAWLWRLDAPDAQEADWLAHGEWLAAAPEHRAAYDRVENLSAEAVDQAPELLAQLSSAVRAAPRRMTVLRFRGRVAQAGMVRWAGAAGGLAAAAAVAAAVLVVLKPAPVPTDSYDAAKGQSRVVALADGSRITLAGGSRIAVRLEKDARYVQMAGGEAIFDVAPDKARPFLIAAADRRIRVVGTEFDVIDHQGLVRVTVRRGLVGVTANAAPIDAEGVLLRAGDQLEHREGDSLSTVQRVDPEVAFAWRRGNLIYRDQMLSDVVGDLNRYFATPVRVAGPAAGLRFSGVLVIDSEDAVVRRLQAFLPISADRAAGGITLQLRPDQRQR